MYFGGSFTYGDDFNSRNYKLEFAYMDTAEMVTPVSTKSYSTLKNQANQKRYIYDSNYAEPLTFEAEIFVNGSTITEEVSREICRKLFNSNEYKWLKLDYPEWNGIHLNCYMVLNEKIYKQTSLGYGVVGYKTTISCDAPFAWEDNGICYIKKLSPNTETSITIKNDTDYEKYTYPTIVINDEFGSIANFIRLEEKDKNDIRNDAVGIQKDMFNAIISVDGNEYTLDLKNVESNTLGYDVSSTLYVDYYDNPYREVNVTLLGSEKTISKYVKYDSRYWYNFRVKSVKTDYQAFEEIKTEDVVFEFTKSSSSSSTKQEVILENVTFIPVKENGTILSYDDYGASGYSPFSNDVCFYNWSDEPEQQRFKIRYKRPNSTGYSYTSIYTITVSPEE